MVKSKPVIILISIIVIGIILFLFFIQSEERQVRKRFKAFARTASTQLENSPLIVAGKSKKISKFFAQTCKIEAPEYNVSRNYSQTDIHAIAFQFLKRRSELKLKFIDLQVEIPEKGTAIAISTVRIIGKVKSGEEYVEENREIECRLKKINDEWLFVNVELIDVLTK
jgi:hypothetical protein